MKANIIAIDDDEDILEIIRLGMGFKGYAVRVSSNATNLIDMIRDTMPDIILLDIRMKGLDGSNICTLLKNNFTTAHLPIIILSANDNISETCKNCGADRYLSKPFDLAELDNVVQQLLSPAA
ncbi:MAG: response regulator [Pedobacter sp.]|nr:MAG: response regulator [Pedobacter sp.]